MQRGLTPMGVSYAGAAMSPSPSPPASVSSASASAAAPLPSISAAHPSGIAKFATAAAPPPADSEVGRTPRSVPGWPATFSGYTLADTAFLSYVRLPVSAGELRGDRDFYPGAYAPQTGYEFGGGSVLSQASFRSPSATPSPPGSSWEAKEMSTVQTRTHITSGAAR